MLMPGVFKQAPNLEATLLRWAAICRLAGVEVGDGAAEDFPPPFLPAKTAHEGLMRVNIVVARVGPVAERAGKNKSGSETIFSNSYQFHFKTLRAD